MDYFTRLERLKELRDDLEREKYTKDLKNAYDNAQNPLNVPSLQDGKLVYPVDGSKKIDELNAYIYASIMNRRNESDILFRR